MKAEKPTVLVLYHYFHPDDVVSARHFSDLARGLYRRGWRVIAMPCNRGCRCERQEFARSENWQGVEIRRLWRPPFRQASTMGRLLNAVWMVIAWSVAALRKHALPKVDVLVVGTDPILSVLIARFWKAFQKRTKIVHWCFDLYPDAALAGGMLGEGTVLHRALMYLTSAAYRRCDLIVDIGPCMRERLNSRAPGVEKITLTPWALAESQTPLPVDMAERKRIFGDARLAVLYSGNFGKAHTCDMFIKLARLLENRDVKFAFGTRGNCADQVCNAILHDSKNITSIPFVPLERLQSRLAAAEVHLVSLCPEWTGTAVPSKFFGSLAVGRPVIFAGSEDSAIAQWIRSYQVGWILSEQTLVCVAERLVGLSESMGELRALQLHCHQVYRDVFSQEKILDSWDAAIRRLVTA